MEGVFKSRTDLGLGRFRDLCSVEFLDYWLMFVEDWATGCYIRTDGY
jgi:hypothetical protein